MDTRFIFEQVQRMRPSSFSEEEQHCYIAEKMMLRQFLLMKQQEQLPDYLSVRDMKTWLLTGRSFLEEFQEIIERTGIDHLFMAELAWTTARLFCLSQMEEELLEELDKERRLSQLFSRKVTLEGLQMLVSIVHPKAEKVAQTFLSALHRKILQIFSDIQIASGPVSAEDAQPAQLMELEQSAAALIPEVVDTALKFLLEDPELENKSEAASAKIGKLLTNSAFPCLSRLGSVSETLLFCVCTKEAQSMVEAIYNRFDQCSRSFKLMDYDESYYTSREGVISAIQGMDHEVQTDAPSQAHFQLEEGLVEEREASPWVALDKEVDFMPKDVAEDTYGIEATLVQDSVVQNMDNDEQMDASSQAHLHMKEELLEKRETSLDLSPLEELEEGVMDQREASPRVALEEEVDTFPNDVTEDKFVKAEILVQDSATEDMDHELHFGASSQAHLQLEEGLLEEREACLEITSSEELDMGIMEVSKMSAQVSLDEEVDTLPKDVIEDTYRKKETLVQVSVHYMDHGVQFHASSQDHIQLEEGLLEEREACLEITSSEELDMGIMEVSKMSAQVSLDEEVDTLPKDVIEDTYRKNETLVQVSVHYMDHGVQFHASSQAHLQLEEGLLEEREACLEITSSEELDMGIMEVSKMSAQVSLDEEVDTLPKDVIEDTYRKNETLVQVSVHYMDHGVQFHASSQDHIQLEEGPLERRKASPRVSLEEMATRISLANRDTSSVKLETNVAVHLVDELEILQQEEVEVYETHDFLVQDCADKKKKKKKKKGLRAFFCGLRKMMTCGFCVPIKQ